MGRFLSSFLEDKMELKAILHPKGGATQERRISGSPANAATLATLAQSAIAVSTAMKSVGGAYLVVDRHQQGALTYQWDLAYTGIFEFERVGIDASAAAGTQIILSSRDGATLAVGPLPEAALRALTNEEPRETCGWCAARRDTAGHTCGLCAAEACEEGL